jgi:prepilin-type N-terminal cleavage/methylation domain-containing protein
MKGRDGFSLIEVVVAIVLLAIILTTLAGFTFATTQSAVLVGDRGSREAVKLATVNRYNALPYEALAAIAGQSQCQVVVINGENDRYETCARVSTGSNRATVWVVVRPLQRGVPADSTRFVRVAPQQQNALCTTGNCAP